MVKPILNAIFAAYLLVLILPASALHAETSPIAENESIVGEAPYSNQWKLEEPSSFLYIAYNDQKMPNPSFQTGGYTTTFNSANSSFPSVDYFARALAFSNSETGFWRHLALWTRYSLGIGLKEGGMTSNAFDLSDVSSNGYLAFGEVRAGANIVFERFRHLFPFVGTQLVFSGYRHTSALSGAEAQAGGTALEFVGGAHVPIFSNRRISLFAEARYLEPFNHLPIYTQGFYYAGGLGFTL